MKSGISTAIWLLSILLVRASTVGYTVNYTDLTPPGAYGGSLWFTSGTLQAGEVDSYATIWNGPSHTTVNLHPSSATYSEVLAGAGNQQGGDTYTAGADHAAYWSGTRSSYRDLNPSWASGSQVLAVTSTRQGGYAQTSNYEQHAGIWSGTASSFVDLHPAGAGYSTVYAMAGNRQGGSASIGGGSEHAALWSGTAASYCDLNPAGAWGSTIKAMTTLQEVGVVGVGEGHAGMWFGTAESFIDLNPSGSIYSEALATIDTFQAGFATWDSYRHALLWSGSANSFIDLQSVLGSAYRESEARSIWTDGITIFVAGDATDYPGYSHPMLWTLTLVPEPGTVSLVGLALTVWAIMKPAKRPNLRTMRPSTF
jgi:hypothetical protein